MKDIIPLIGRSLDSNVFVILGRRNALIDTGAGLSDSIAKEVLRVAGKVDLIINTHGHIDHCGGNKYFKNAEVLAHEEDVDEMKSGNFYGTCSFVESGFKANVDRTIGDGDEVALGEYTFKVMGTPGHTPGSICLYEKSKKILISGDTLFAGGGFGRTDMGGDAKAMLSSLEKLSKLDFDLLFPGHGGVVEGGSRQAKMALENAREFLDG